MKVQGFTDIGIRYKDNQDTYWSAVFEDDFKNQIGVLLICDGMGGLYDGSLASKTVVKAIRRKVISGYFNKQDLLDAILEANKELLDLGTKTKKPIGTTCSVLIASGGEYYGWHIGDSRLYHFRNEKFKILTEDHTALNSRRKKGIEVSKEEEIKLRSALSRCLGVVKNPRVDYISGTYILGDSFVACSDGFWHYWDGRTNDLQETINTVKEFGETDNITVTKLELSQD